MPPKRQPQSPIQRGLGSSRPVASPGPSGFHGSPNAASTPFRLEAARSSNPASPRANMNTSPPASPCPSTSSISSFSSISTIHSLSPQPNGNGFQAGQTFHNHSTSNDAYPPAYVQRSIKTHYFEEGARVKYVESAVRMEVPFRHGHATKGIIDQNGARIFQSPNLYQQHQQAVTARQYCQVDPGNGTPIQRQIPQHRDYSMYCSPPRTPTAPQQTPPHQSPLNNSGVRSFGSQTTAPLHQHHQEQHQGQPSAPEMTKRGWWGTR